SRTRRAARRAPSSPWVRPPLLRARPAGPSRDWGGKTPPPQPPPAPGCGGVPPTPPPPPAKTRGGRASGVSRGETDGARQAPGDALEDAGVTDAAVLGHCRRPGAHMGDCFVLGLLEADWPSKKKAREGRGEQPARVQGEARRGNNS